MAKGKNQIRGLTVKIGGDTSDLAAELEKIQKRTEPITSELSSINKLLKFNPGNAELLAQKQTVLAKAISETENKLKLLKEAEADVQKQFEKGEITEEQFRALKREIEATKGKLEHYKKEAQETAEAQDKLGKASGEAADGIDDAGNAAKDTASDIKKLDDASKKAEQSTNDLGEKLKSGLKTGFKAAISGAIALIAALGAATESTRELRTGLAKLDTAFETNGFSAKQGRKLYNDLYAVLGDSDRVIETEGNLSKLCSTQEDLNKWVEISTGVYAQFGDGLPIEGLAEAANETAKVAKITGPLADAINWSTTNTEDWNEALSGNSAALAKFQDAMGQGLSAEDAFNEALLACNNEQERQSLITNALTYLYKDQAEAYKENASSILEANRAQAAMEQSLAAVGGAVEPVMSSVKMLGAELLDKLIPSIKELSGGFTDLIAGADNAGQTIAKGITDIVMTIIGQITSILPTAADIAGKASVEIIHSLSEMAPQLLSTILEIAGALLEEAVSVLVEFLNIDLPLIIDTIITFFSNNAEQIFQTGMNLLVKLAIGIINAIPQLVAMLPHIISAVIDFLTSSFPQILLTGCRLLLALATGIINAIPQLVSQLPKIISSITNALKGGLSAMWSIGRYLVEGLWQGISSSLSWIRNKITGWVGNVLDFMRKLFGINSPATTTKWMGKMLDYGLGGGIEENADVPLTAMEDLGDDLLNSAGRINGATINRQLNATFSGSAAAESLKLEALIERLDRYLPEIISRTDRPMVLDDGTLVGRTIGKVNAGLANVYELEKRGVK